MQNAKTCCAPFCDVHYGDMETVPDLIEALGGSTRLAGKLRLPIATVGAWKARGSIPPRYFPTLVRIAAQQKVKGVTLESLVAMRVSA